jgi:hypothetical protein
MKPKYSHLLKVILTLVILLFSCSKEISKHSSEIPNGYLSPIYEDESFENVSMDICFPKYELFPNSDTEHIHKLVEFNEAFNNYFPEGIKLFSTITKVGWIFYEVKYGVDIPEYHTIVNDGLDYYLLLPDSLSKFQRESNADFLFVLYYSGFTPVPPDSSTKRLKYSTTYEIEYAIWDRGNLEILTKDIVSAKVEFDRVVNKWPYRAAITKSAALIFEKLPMFEK